MIILATKWSTAWLMTGMGIGAVFFILILLVLILQIFSMVFAEDKKPKRFTKKAAPVGDFKEQVEGYEEDMAAVATAVYLYLNSAHDEESGVLTIQQDQHSLWHAELNEKL